MKFTITFLFLCGSFFCKGQRIDKHIYQPYQHKADSIVMHFVGQNFFEQNIKPDSSKSKYCITTKKGITCTPFSKPLKFKPSFFVFHYVLSHPQLTGEIFPITFALDSLKQFSLIPEITGLINALDFNEGDIVSKEEALKICETQKDKLKKNNIRLAWYNHTVDYEKSKRTHNLADVWTGSIVWQVKSQIKFRGKVYDGMLYVDVFTGQVSRHYPDIPWD